MYLNVEGSIVLEMFSEVTVVFNVSQQPAPTDRVIHININIYIHIHTHICMYIHIQINILT